MDVILDSNVYVSDYRMESIAFKNLFDYLKRTSSSLVLLRIVREEVVAHFGRDLKKRGKEVAEAWRAYRPLHFPEKLEEFTKPDVGGQTKKLRQKLMAPSPSVKVEYYSETTRVSVDDVFIRGIHRTAPANNQGEELRDVIVWLIALDYSKHMNREVAFISDDSGFWLGDDIHPQIQDDIKKHGGAVRVYRNIDNFVEENSPPAKSVDEKWASEVFPEFADAIVDEARRASRRPFGTVKSVVLKDQTFKEGKIFEVAPDVHVAELLFSVALHYETQTVSNMVPLTALLGDPGANPFLKSDELPGAFPGVFAQAAGGLPWNWIRPLGMASGIHSTTIENQYSASAIVRLSARLVKGQISEKEVTELQIEHIEETKSPNEPADRTLPINLSVPGIPPQQQPHPATINRSEKAERIRKIRGEQKKSGKS